jgi:hypothetical protein
MYLAKYFEHNPLGSERAIRYCPLLGCFEDQELRMSLFSTMMILMLGTALTVFIVSIVIRFYICCKGECRRGYMTKRAASNRMHVGS